MNKWNPTEWLTATPLEYYLGTEDITIPAGVKLIEQSGLVVPPTKLSSYTGITSETPTPTSTSNPDSSSSDVRVLDLGAGLGQVSNAIIKAISTNRVNGDSIKIIAGDHDDSLLEELRRREREYEGWENVKVEKMDALNTGKPDNSFDYLFGNFLYFLTANPVDALKDVIHILVDKVNSNQVFKVGFNQVMIRMSKYNPENWLTTTLYEDYEGTEDITLPAARKLCEQSGLITEKPSLSSYTGMTSSGSNKNSLNIIDKRVTILDNGSGLGQVTKVLVDEFKLEKKSTGVNVIAGEIDESLLERLRKRKSEEGWDIVEVEKIDTLEINKPDNSFDFVFSNFLYFLLSDPIKGLKESIRILKPGGILSFSTWAYAGPFHLLQHAQSLLPDYPLTPSPPPSQWGHPRYIKELLLKEEFGLKEIKIEPFEYVQIASSAAEMAKKMHVVVKVITSRWGGERKELGWNVFEKIEELLKRDQGDGPVRIRSVALIVTAKKV